MSGEIRVIEPVSDDEFVARYLRPPQPVVIRGLYATRRIGAIRSIDDARAAWGKARVPVQLEYTTRDLIRRVDKTVQIMPLSAFLARSPDDPDTRRLVVGEQPIDDLPELRDWFEPPSYATVAGATLADMQMKLFAAHRGHWAHAHYDLDGRAVLLSQVFGRKRVLVVPPDRGQLLDPMLDGAGHWSSLFLENLDEAARLALARQIGAYECILEPGDTVLIPTAWWHYVDYLETGLGFNVRIGRTEYQRKLFDVARALQPRHMHYWQGIAQAFATGRDPSQALCGRVDELLARLAEARAGKPGAAARFGEEVVALYRSIEPDAYSKILTFNDLVRAEPIVAIDATTETSSGDASGDARSWTANDRVGVARDVELVETLANDEDRELVILTGGVVSWRIGTSGSGAQTYRVGRALLQTLAGAREPITVTELANRLDQPVDEILGMIGELAETGAVVWVGDQRASSVAASSS